jgi:solute carrier family 13 (sodium-dependent dicarboxylate transporter), member 2/3/5
MALKREPAQRTPAARLKWGGGLLLAISVFAVVISTPPPQSLRVAASKTLVTRLPLELQGEVKRQVGPPLTPRFAERFDTFEALARHERVAVHKKGGEMIRPEAYDRLSPRGKRAYEAPVAVSNLVDRITVAAWYVLAVALLMMVLWVTGVLPVSVTALIPLLLFPVLQIAHLSSPSFPTYFSVGSRYGHWLIFLFMGTFMLSKAMIRWRLDRRVAMHILGLFGSRPSVLMLGFILAAAFLSMWISNTATAAMMTPIAMAVVERIDHPEAARYRTGVLLSVAYGATVGGIATLVGSPPNGIFAGYVAAFTGESVGFAQWLAFGLPFVIIFLPVLWIVQSWRFVPAGLKLPPRSAIVGEGLGPLSRGEKLVGMVFLIMVALWLTRSPIGFLGWPGWSKLSLMGGVGLGWANDASVVLLGVFLLFGLPVDLERREFILDLKTGMDISWETLLLFGGGLALGQAIASTGLATWFAGGLEEVAKAGPHVVLLAVALFGSFVTEVTSNTATATMLMPVLFALGRSVGGMEMTFMSTGAVATSLAFMLPIATPPNAVVYGSGAVTMGQMARAGVVLNFLAVLCWWLVASVTFL